jgi:Tol biopolymer transport system component
MLIIPTRRFIAGLVLGLAVLIATLPLATPVEAAWHTLTGLLPNNITVQSWQFSPNSRYVVYHLLERGVNGRPNLYSVPITGGLPVKLTPQLLAGGYIGHFAITPDSQYVIYIAEQETLGHRDLYRVPLTGGMAVKLNLLNHGEVGVGDFKIDPDNARVVYLHDYHNQSAQFILYSVPITGGPSKQLNISFEDGKNVGFFDIDPVRDRVVYVANRDTLGHNGLFSVPIAGGAVTKISMPNMDVANGFEIYRSPSSPIVVFSAAASGSNSANLYRNPTDGSGVLTKLNYPFASNETVIGYQVSPDGLQVVYNVAVSSATNPNPARGNLYSVPFISGESLSISPAATPGFGVIGNRFFITADSQRVAYEQQQNEMVNPVLESVALNSSQRKFLYSRGSGEQLGEWKVSPNGQRVVYITSPSYSAYSIPTTGGAQTPLGQGNFLPLLITPDSSRVIYPTNQLSGNWDLYSQLTGGGEARNLSLLPSGAEVIRASINPDGRWIVFEVHYPTGRIELRVSDGAEAQPPTSTLYPVYLPMIIR